MIAAMICLSAPLLLARGSGAAYPSAAIEVLRDRAAFYRRMAKVREGMAVADIKRLIGTPDDIRRGEDELGGTVADEIWCYGTDRHLGFPTLAEISIAKGKVYFL